MTLNGVKVVFLRYYTEGVRFKANGVNILEARSTLSATEM